MAKEYIECGTCAYFGDGYLCKLLPRWVSKEITSGCYLGEVKKYKMKDEEETNDG